MNRRSFLVCAAAAAVLRKLPPAEPEWIRIAEAGVPIPPAPYKSGFLISRELLEDDLYGSLDYAWSQYVK
jgi:hypothetical protein